LKHFVRIDMGTEEGHGAAGMKTAGGDAKRVDAELEVNGISAVAKHGGNARGSDGIRGGRANKIKVESNPRNSWHDPLIV
jgi:hypothetical protein